MDRRTAVFSLALAASGVAFGITFFLVFLVAPVEQTMGIVQKIFYVHVPSAYAMYLGATACFGGSIAYLLRPNEGADAFAKAGAELAVVFGALVLTTGPLWAAKAWGHYWTWDPRLTTSLLSVLVYLAYLVLRNFAGGGDAEKRFAAALGILGAANLPVIHWSVQRWSGQHPTVITGKGGGLAHPAMTMALSMSFLAFTIFAVALLGLRVRGELLHRRLAAAEDEAWEKNLVPEDA